METNKKYEAVYNEALSKKAPAPDPDGPMIECADGSYKPATPIGYEPEQLEWDALHDIIETAFVKDKDYVCWSDGGYTKKSGDILETKEGRLLQKYDAVLLLGSFGEPLGFMMFTGEVETTERDRDGSYYAYPVFSYIGKDDELHNYEPKVFIPGEGLKKEKAVIEPGRGFKIADEDVAKLDEDDRIEYDIDINDDGDDLDEPKDNSDMFL